MHKALYRKYRPYDFSSVVGQDSIIKTLRNSVTNNNFSHAYMFFGPRGVGKTTVSKILARSVNCLNPINGEACGKCKNCEYSFDKECVDIIEIDAASNNGVDEIRDLRNKVTLVPANLKYKVYIIDEVHMLSIGAFNALLKTLEEPPAHVIFILATTDPQKVPDTIISRCQCFSFNRISNSMIEKRLRYVCDQEKILIDDSVLREIAIASDGGLRDALGMLDKLTAYTSERITIDDFAELNGIITRETLSCFFEDVYLGNLTGVLEKIDSFNNSGKNLIQILVQLMNFIRDIIVKYYVDKISVDYDIDKLLVFVNTINEKMFDIKQSTDPKIYLEMFLIKCIKEIFGINSTCGKNISREIKTVENNEVVDNKTVENNIEPDQEFDFNSEFGDNEDSEIEDNYQMEKSNIILNKDTEFNSLDDDVDKKSLNNTDDDTDKESYLDNNKINKERKILNIDDINTIRVNNIMATADKKLLLSEKEIFSKLNDYSFDQNFGYLVCSLLDGKIRAVSDFGLILSYDYDALVDKAKDDLTKLIEVYNNITGSNKKIAVLSDEQWNLEKNKYIDSIRKGNYYVSKEEPVPVYEEIKNDGIINKAIELFGDIVEISDNKGE